MDFFSEDSNVRTVLTCEYCTCTTLYRSQLCVRLNISTSETPTCPHPRSCDALFSCGLASLTHDNDSGRFRCSFVRLCCVCGVRGVCGVDVWLWCRAVSRNGPNHPAKMAFCTGCSSINSNQNTRRKTSTAGPGDHTFQYRMRSNDIVLFYDSATSS